MAFTIEVLKVAVNPQGKFRIAVVDHKTSDGKVDSKKLVSFGAGKAAFDVLSQAQQGDQFEVESKKIKNEKDGKEYWTWVAATGMGKSGPVSANKVAQVRSSYETPTERAARQVYIVRQSSVANAIAFLARDGARPPVEAIIDVAKQFEAYVFANTSQDVVLPSEVE